MWGGRIELLCGVRNYDMRRHDLPHSRNPKKVVGPVQWGQPSTCLRTMEAGRSFLRSWQKPLGHFPSKEPGSVVFSALAWRSLEGDHLFRSRCRRVARPRLRFQTWLWLGLGACGFELF